MTGRPSLDHFLDTTNRRFEKRLLCYSLVFAQIMSDARSMIAKWKNNPPMSKSERDALRTKGDYPAELWYDNKSKPAASGFMTSAMTDLDDSGGAEPRLKSTLPKPTSSFDKTSGTVGSALNATESRIGSTMKRSQVVANRRTPQERLRRYEGKCIVR